MLISLLPNSLSLFVALPPEQLASAQHEVDYAITHLPADPPNVATDPYPARTLRFAWPRCSSTTSSTMVPGWDLHNRTRYAAQTGRDIASPKMLTPLLTFQVDAQTGTEYSFGQLLDDCHRAATALCRLGLRIGDVVGFHCVNSYELMIAMCGTFFAGGAAVLLKANLTQG
ncbi:hypothetical protein HPB52_002668 [Rhipicephalus sanguineus]|uniref:AMP-dependent synthetase/ligase domain-containing protein n=1 Tax=Rhipicephalus sanguineus TaxID=34632 RepID=A0A9D4PCF5_RHISA|nr:hypothetical protein HPB52_002668 [Rhipicephalus sanguineus]